MNGTDTIAAIATAPGRGGVAVVRVSGPEAHQVASTLTGRRIDASSAGRFFHAAFRVGNQTIDDGLVLVFAAPHSYTGEDVVELQGHGGSVAPRRVLEACLVAGARLARRGEFTERAFLNGRLDLGAAEAVIDLVDARTERAADDAVARLGGASAQELENLYLSAIEISSQIEHALDFDESELPEDFGAGLAADITALHSRIERKLTTAREGRILREGALVVLAGAPNAGKSSLLNALLGEGRAIVSDEAGTTRDSIEEWMEIGGWPVRLVDTAGLRTAEGTIEAEGVARAEALIQEADLVLHLISSAEGVCPPLMPAKGDCPLLANGDSPQMAFAKGDSPQMMRGGDDREISIVSKCDLLQRGQTPREKGQSPCDGNYSLLISSKTGDGLEDLKNEIAARLAKLATKDAEETGADVTTRQKECLLSAREALDRATAALDSADWVVAANELRAAAESLGRLLGKVYSEDLLDALFSRFCVGK